MSAISNIFDHYFEPVVPMFTREMAEAIVNRQQTRGLSHASPNSDAKQTTAR